MRNYTLKQLQTFIEVAREKSVSRAADRLFVTQPAVSMQIRQLEEAFGLALIEPVGRNIQLTRAGEEFLIHAIAAIGKLKDLEASMAEHVGAKKGRIELGIVSTAKYFVPMLLVRFAKIMPGIEIVLRIDNRDNILGMMSRNELDLVIMGRTPANLDCEATPFASNPLSIIAPPDHPLLKRKRLSFDAVKDYPFVVRERGSGTRASMERLFQQYEIPMKIAMEMPSNETIKQAVMAGMGMSFLSLRTVRHEMAAGLLAQLDVSGMPIVGKWFVTHLSQKKLSPAAQAFKKFLVEHAEPLMDEWA
jgi:DNA-binding transcriptional LysR family regulator